MRIDKFLWCVRKFKTRGLAAEALRKDHVRINDEPVKASRSVKVGDVITLRRDAIEYRFEIIKIPASRIGAKLVEEHITDRTSPEQLEKLSFIAMVQKLHRQKGTGRPTKKERRDLDDFRDTPD